MNGWWNSSSYGSSGGVEIITKSYSSGVLEGTFEATQASCSGVHPFTAKVISENRVILETNIGGDCQEMTITLIRENDEWRGEL